jgi:hypothetical protein
LSRPVDDHDLFHDNGYVEDCQDCADEEATAEAEQLAERLNATADARLESIMRLWMTTREKPAADFNPAQIGPKFTRGDR